MKDRQEHYKQGGFYIRKRKVKSKGVDGVIGFHDWAIMISKEFGSWKIASRHDTEDECDFEIDQYVANYNNCIYEQ